MGERSGKMAKGLYLHIPFCDQICTYCDFPKLLTTKAYRLDYVHALIEELELSRQLYDFDTIETIYIGGGTPSALTPSQLEVIFNWLAAHIEIETLKEFSIEANPENLTAELVELFKSAGVTRVSIGVQSFETRLLKIVGRAHRSEDVINAIQLLQAAKIPHINVDLIYAIPTQTMAELESDLQRVNDLGVTHVSAYSLILEPHTSLYLDYMKDKLTLLENEVEAAMFERVITRLSEMGFSHYEVSNFTKSEPSYHNQWYWQTEDYIGVGLGAHGSVDGVRYENTRSITRYIKDLKANKRPLISSHTLTKEEQIEETLFLGLRLMAGIDIDAVNEKHQINLEEIYPNLFDELIKKGWLQRQGNHISLTKDGLMMANEVFEQFLLSC